MFRYVLKPLRPGWTWLEEKILFRHFERRIIEVAEQEKPQVIHAHTPYRVGLPAMRAARKLDIPFVYEMRGMWEETAVANGISGSVTLRDGQLLKVAIPQPYRPSPQ